MLKSGINIRISRQVHSELVAHLEEEDRRMGRFTEIAIREKIEKEKKNIKPKPKKDGV